MLRWLTAHRLEYFTGITRDAANANITKGIWIEGLHWRKAPSGRRFFHFESEIFPELENPSGQTFWRRNAGHSNHDRRGFACLSGKRQAAKPGPVHVQGLQERGIVSPYPGLW